jgi:hypothetical protein
LDLGASGGGDAIGARTDVDDGGVVVTDDVVVDDRRIIIDLRDARSIDAVIPRPVRMEMADRHERIITGAKTETETEADVPSIIGEADAATVDGARR